MSLAETLTSSPLLDPVRSYFKNLFGWEHSEFQTAMLFVFWFTVLLLILVAINLYLKVSRRRDRIISEQEKSVNVDENDVSVETSGNDLGSVPEEPLEAQRHPENFTEKPVQTNQSYRDWMNDVIQWFFQRSNTDHKFVDDTINSWMTALNSNSAKNTDLFVEFTELDLVQCSPLNIVQVGEPEEINGNIIAKLKATCDRLVMQVRVAPDQFADATKSAIYDIVLERFSILLKSVCMNEDSALVIQALERPETKAQIGEPVLGSKNKFLPDMIVDAILNSFTSSVTTLDVGHFKDFPRMKNQDGEPIMTESQQIAYPSRERKLLLKLIKGIDFNLDPEESHGIYTTIELDEPLQSFKTPIERKNVCQPFWDQHFIFKLNERSSEILFEVFDGSKDDYKEAILADAIVNISELVANPSQQQNLLLRKGKKDFGYLAVEFLLMEYNNSNGTRLPPVAPITNYHHQRQPSRQETFSRQDSNRPLSVSEGACSIPDDFADYPPNSDHDGEKKNEPEISLKEGIEDLTAKTSRRSTASSTVSKSSFLNSLGTDDIQPVIDAQTAVSPGNDDSVDLSSSSSTVESCKSTPSGNSINNQNRNYDQEEKDEAEGQRQQNGNGVIHEDNNNGSVRSSNKKRQGKQTSSNALERQIPSTEDSPRLSLLGKLRRSFKRRSKSVDRSTYGSFKREDTPTIVQDDMMANSAPGSREPSMPKETISGKNKQESFTNLSQASTRTFMHENSTIVVEFKNKGVTSFTRAPNNHAEMRKLLKRRGFATKLHLYNNHLFAARHMASGTVCEVCGGRIGFSIGKQAYQCRGCNIVCHKPCHVKVDKTCSSNIISDLKIGSMEREPLDCPELTITEAE